LKGPGRVAQTISGDVRWRVRNAVCGVLRG
jgi:hypothetical protein